MKGDDEALRDDLSDVEKKGFLARITALRPRNGSVESFENHTYEAGHPVDWNEACGVFRDPNARFLRAGDNWYLAVGHAWEDGRLLLVVFDLGDKGIATLITARPADAKERRGYEKGRR